MNKFKKVFLATDFDGTLVNSKKQLLARDRDAIAYFREHGGKFTVCSGRVYPSFSILTEIVPLLSAPALLANGASAYDFSKDKLLYEILMPAGSGAMFARLAERFPEAGVEYHTASEILLVREDEVSKRHMRMLNLPIRFCAFDCCEKTLYKGIFTHPDHAYLEKIADAIRAEYPDRYSLLFSCDTFLEVMDRQVNKGFGVLKMAEALGIERKDIYCVGDHENDIDMLRVAALSFAPANGLPRVTGMADVVTRTNEEGCVSHVIEVLDKRY